MPVQTITFKTSYTDWKDAFEAWVEVVGMDIVDAWRMQARLIAQRLIGGTSAKDRKAFGWNRATPPGTQKQGENALVRDIQRAVFPLKADGFHDIKVRKKIKLAIRDIDIPALQEMVRKGVFGAARVSMHVLPAGNEYTAHKNSIGSRGRVTSKTPKFAVPGDEYLKKYIAEAKHAVGQGKGGWAASLIALGGSCSQWIARHVKSGGCIDGLTRGRENLTFAMINRSKWASGGDEDRIIDTVMGDRAAVIAKDMEGIIERSFRTGNPRSIRNQELVSI